MKDLSFLSDDDADDDAIEPAIDSDSSSSEKTLRFSPINTTRDTTFTNLNDLNIESNIAGVKVFSKKHLLTLYLCQIFKKNFCHFTSI